MTTTINRTYKYRIEMKKSQATRLENWFSMCRYAWNWWITDRKLMYEHQGESVGYFEQKRDLPRIKAKRPWFKDAPADVLQDVALRLDKSYQAFFNRVKKGDKDSGYPQYKKRGQWMSITFPRFLSPVSEMTKIPKLGMIRVIMHRPIPKDSHVKTLTIIREGGHYYACFSVEQEINISPIEIKQDLRVVGIDLGCTDLYVDSDGQHIVAPRFFRKGQKRLAKLQRRFSKETKYTKKWYKLLLGIQKAHAHIAAQRNDFLHKKANALLANADVIVFEDLRIANMTRRPKPKTDDEGVYTSNGASAKSGLNKSILDAGWGKFVQILEYKAQAMGKLMVKVPPHYTSQMCSACGVMVQKSLSHRTHRCECGYVGHRDHNAALNIRNLGLLRLGLKPLAVSVA